MRTILLSTVLGFVAFATAGVLQDANAPRAATTTNNFCAIVTKLVTIAKQQAAATTYCSSYLGLPAGVATTVTVTSTTGIVMTKTVQSPAATNTITTTTGTTTITSSVASCPRHAVTASKCGIDGDVNHQERRAAVPKPSCLSSYAGALLSSACKCLSIPTATGATSTSTKLVTTTSTSTVTNGSSGTSTSTIKVQATSTVYKPPALSCNFGPSAAGNTFSPYFAGCSVTSRGFRSGACILGIGITSFGVTACEAAQGCIDGMSLYQVKTQDSFEMYLTDYSATDNTYVCVYCDKLFGQASDFDQEDDTYVEVYGFNKNT